MPKVRITKLPMARTGYQVKYSLANDVPAMGGADYNVYTGEKQLKPSKYITAVPREEANLEAEGGETVFGDLNGDGMPESKIIKGPRHNGKKPGGVPLNLPDDTYIYSDFRGMNIKDPKVLAMFGKTGKNRGYTPADLDKQYDIMKYRTILQDPNSDDIDIKTAELMIKNYTMKKGALALAAEASKGFPQGIPAVAKPYMQANGIQETDLIPEQLANLSKQVDGQLKSQNRQAEDETDESFSEYDAAQDINQGQPVAQPTMAQYGMTMGGYDMPFTDEAGTDYSIPAAEYGMSMGVNSNNYQGRTRNISGSGPVYPFNTRRVPVRAYGGQLNSYQDKGAVKEEVKPIDITDKTKDEIAKEIYLAEKKLGKGNVQLIRDGKKVKYNFGNLAIPTGKDLKSEEITGAGFPNNDAGRAAAAQFLLYKKHLDNPTVRKEFIKSTQEVLDDPAKWGSKVKGEKGWSKRYGEKPNEDAIINNALAIQKRNLKFAAEGVYPRIFNDSGSALDTPEEIVRQGVPNPNKGGQPFTVEEARKLVQDYKNKGWTSVAEAAKSIGVPLETSGKDRILQQGTSHAYATMNQNYETGKMKYENPEDEYAISSFVGNIPVINAGRADNPAMNKLYGKGIGSQISPMDDVYDVATDTEGNPAYYDKSGQGVKYGNTTAEQLSAVAERELNLEDVPEVKVQKCPCQKSDGTIIDVGFDPNTKECNECSEDLPYDVEKPAEWWLQDTIKTAGAFGDLMRAKKYMPWAPTAKLETPKATFLDPTRELAAQAEQANIQTQALGQFAGPQGLSARSAGIQGQAAKQAADTLSRYNNANVNLANQYESANVNIRNQDQAGNQAIKKGLYDANAVANQQFDNTKGALRGNFRNQYANAITNRFKTDALNQINPQYAVSPGVGGQLQFTQGKKIKPEASGQSYKQLYDYFASKGDKNPAYAAKQAMGIKTAGDDEGLAALQAQYGQMKRGGFIYADMITPFLL